MLALGVVIPTKNSMKYLPRHLEHLSTWIDLAEQVVVVDSFSQDGTVDYIKKNLHHPNIHFVNHPPGLYASWNHGIRQLTTDYCYISTVGDSLARAGAEHLVSNATHMRCDVLVSRPNFVNEAGQPCEGPEWPMDDIIKTLQLKKPCRLSSAVIVATALIHTGGAITGSCASDLFRTEILQKYPFPLDAGTAGDGAWSLQNAGRVNWAATAEKVSTFRRHPSTASAQELQDSEKFGKYSKTARAMVEAWLAGGAADFPDQIISDMKQLLSFSIEYEQCRRQYNLYRKNRWPWSLNPAAWQARIRRNQMRQQVFDLKAKIFRNAQQSLFDLSQQL